jgi:hypothetical protein
MFHFPHSRLLASFCLLACLLSACVQNTAITFQDGKICDVPASGDPQCADLGPGQMVIFQLDDSNKVQLKSVPYTLKSQMGWLKRTNRAYPFAAGHIGGTRNGSVVRIFETGTATQDTVSDLKIALKSVAWLGFVQESAGDPVMMMMAGGDPCADAFNVNDSLLKHGEVHIFREGTCAYASGGGLGVIVIESNIIDPTMRVNLLGATPDIGDWIKIKYPTMKPPTTIHQAWLYQMQKAPIKEPLFAQPQGGTLSDLPDPCGTIEMMREKFGKIEWADPICGFPLSAWEVRYCGATNIVSFRNSDAQLVEFDLSSSCAFKFKLEGNVVSVSLQAGCTLDLGAVCAGSNQ